MKVSIAITVLNEEKTITGLLQSIANQTKKPDEVIVVDGGSSDGTIAQIQNSKFKIQNYPLRREASNLKFKIFVRRGNRAEGRNYAISKAKNDIVAITDAGCILDKNWLKNINQPLKDAKIDVVSGYYSYSADSIFQKCLVPYVLVMPDKVDAKNFLPSARSMAIRKSIWKEVGGFPKEYPLNEDYVFALKLKKMGKQFYFAKKAIVYWLPRENLKKSFLMFYYFAKGDIQAKIVRPKVVLLFLRYIIGLILAILSILGLGLGIYLIFAVVVYIIWAIVKNYRYVKDLRAIAILPVLQITADLAVLAGSISGVLDK